jgi:DNA-binding transcriptional ArsR family regulator
MRDMAEAEIEKWAENLKIVGHPVRLLTLLALYASEMFKRENHSLTNGEIKEFLGEANESALEYHLKILEDAKFIRKDAHKDKKTGSVYPLYHIEAAGKSFLDQTGLIAVFKEKIERLAAAA